jgi:polysaccharide biosynthesis protein PslH
VLFLAHRAPFPPDKGDRLRAWRHLQRLAALGPVDLVALADDERDADAARAGLAPVCRELHVLPRRRARALLGVGGALLGGGSLSAAWHADARLARALAGLHERHRYDLLWAFSSGTWPWWRRCRATRRIVDLCDLDALKWEALARRGGPRAALWRLEARRLLPLELRLAEEADLVLLITPQEGQDLAARGGRPRRLELLTNGVDARAFEGLAPPSAAGPVFAFLGQMDYPPNVAAAVHLARDELPRVRRRVPEARLVVLGRSPAPEVAALARAGEVEVTGAIASVPAALERVAVFAAPLDEGRGLPNKVLEALAAGRPVVVSSWAARALTGQPGRDYLVADGADARAEAIAGLLLEPARRDALGAAGRAHVLRAHDWDEVLARLERLVRETVRA